MSIRFAAVRDWLRPQLSNNAAVVVPGPDDPDSPGAYVKLTRTGGSEMELEGLLDMVEWQAESVGDQFDYDSAEQIALEVDALFLGASNLTMGGVRVVSVWRTGGSPAPLLVDDATRHHFVCSYIWRVQSGLA